MATEGMQSLGSILRRVTARAKAEREKLLASGLSPDGGPGDPDKGQCPRCWGTKFLAKPVDPRLGDLSSEPKVPCPDCTPLPQWMRQYRFDNLDRREGDLGPEQSQMLMTAAREALGFAKGTAPYHWLVLTGNPGTAKTHLGFAILTYRYEHPEAGVRGAYVNAPEYLDALFQGIRDNTYERHMERYQGEPLLMLDDLGAENAKRGTDGDMGFAESKLFQLLESRMTRRLPTIITTNTPIGKFNYRVADRLLSDRNGFSRVVALDLPSYRSGRQW